MSGAGGKRRIAGTGRQDDEIEVGDGEAGSLDGAASGGGGHVTGGLAFAHDVTALDARVFLDPCRGRVELHLEIRVGDDALR